MRTSSSHTRKWGRVRKKTPPARSNPDWSRLHSRPNKPTCTRPAARPAAMRGGALQAFSLAGRQGTSDTTEYLSRPNSSQTSRESMPPERQHHQPDPHTSRAKRRVVSSVKCPGAQTTDTNGGSTPTPPQLEIPLQVARCSSRSSQASSRSTITEPTIALHARRKHTQPDQPLTSRGQFHPCRTRRKSAGYHPTTAPVSAHRRALTHGCHNVPSSTARLQTTSKKRQEQSAKCWPMSPFTVQKTRAQPSHRTPTVSTHQLSTPLARAERQDRLLSTALNYLQRRRKRRAYHHRPHLR